MNHTIVYASLAGILWGTYPPILKHAMAKHSDDVVAFITMTITAGVIALAFTLAPSVRASFSKIKTHLFQLWPYVISAIIGPILATFLFIKALSTKSNPGITVAIAFSLPMVVSALISRMCFNTPFTSLNFIGMLLIIGGVMVFQI